MRGYCLGRVLSCGGENGRRSLGHGAGFSFVNGGRVQVAGAAPPMRLRAS